MRCEFVTPAVIISYLISGRMEIVKVNKPKLIKWLRGDELILQYVQSNGLITMDEYGRLNSISDPGQKTTMILDLMMKKGNGVCQEFLEMLKNDEVNESRPELKSWIATVNTSSSSLSSSGTDFGWSRYQFLDIDIDTLCRVYITIPNLL